MEGTLRHPLYVDIGAVSLDHQRNKTVAYIFTLAMLFITESKAN